MINVKKKLFVLTKIKYLHCCVLLDSVKYEDPGAVESLAGALDTRCQVTGGVSISLLLRKRKKQNIKLVMKELLNFLCFSFLDGASEELCDK